MVQTNNQIIDSVYKNLFKKDYDLILKRNIYLRPEKLVVTILVFFLALSLGLLGALLIDAFFLYGYVVSQAVLCLLCGGIGFWIFLGKRKYFLEKHGENAYSYAFIRCGLVGLAFENAAFVHILWMGGQRLLPLPTSLPLAFLAFYFYFALISLLRSVLGYYNMMYIGHYFPKKGFISGNIYSIIKHPNFLAASLLAVALAFVRSTFYSFAGALVMVIMNVSLAYFEERELAERTKGEYEVYKQKVPGFIPRIRDLPRFFSLVSGIKFPSSKIDVVLFFYSGAYLDYSDVNAHARIPAPLGLLYIATLLEDYGYKVELVDARLPDFSIPQFFELLKISKPKIVGFLTFTDFVYKTADLATKVKECHPEMKVVLGGPHIVDDSIFDICKCDVLVRYEGEYTTLELADHFIRRQGKLAEIKGISYRDNNNEIKKNVDRPPIDDLDCLPIPKRKFLKEPSKFYLPSIMTSRGCPYECTFCVEARCAKKYFRMRSFENVIDEVNMLVRDYGEQFVCFMDDTFIVSKERIGKLCEYFKRELVPKGFYWWCEGRVNIFFQDLEMIHNMKEAGMVSMQIGIESGSQKVLDAYKKNVTLEQIEKVVGKCYEEEVLVFGNFILGGPYESEEIINQGIDFAIKLLDLAPGFMELYALFLVPFPGTEITENAAKYGIKVIDPLLIKGRGMFSCATETVALNKARLVELHEKFNLVILSKLLEQLNKIPKSAVDKNFFLEKFGWGNHHVRIFRTNPVIAAYYDRRRTGPCKYLNEINMKMLWALYPTRLLPLSYVGGKVFVSNQIKNLTLDGLEANIYELSSGKNSFRSIVGDLSTTEEGKQLSQEEIVKRAVEFYGVLDENWLLVFNEL